MHICRIMNDGVCCLGDVLPAGIIKTKARLGQVTEDTDNPYQPTRPATIRSP